MQGALKAESAGHDPAATLWLKNGRTPSTIAETGARLRALASVVPADQIEALRRIDSDEAASALWPHLDASPTVRDAAFEALVALNDPRLVPTLAAVARDSNLEGTPLLVRVESELAKRSKPLSRPPTVCGPTGHRWQGRRSAA